MAIMSRPTEQTQVMASSFSSVNAPHSRGVESCPTSSLTGINAPERPPTWEEAITPPFFTASFSKRQRRRWCRGCRTASRPISSRMCRHRIAHCRRGRQGQDPQCRRARPAAAEASRATNCPTRVIRKAVRLIVSATTSKDCALARLPERASTTPGPLTPTLIAQSPSPGPWNAPAMKGLSSTALEKTTSLAQPRPSWSLGALGRSFTASPQQRHRVHVDARPGGGHVHGGADQLGVGKRLGAWRR